MDEQFDEAPDGEPQGGPAGAPDDYDGDDHARAPLLPPDDRLWRHPSELGAPSSPPAGRTGLRSVALLSAAISALLVAGSVTAAAQLGRKEPSPSSVTTGGDVIDTAVRAILPSLARVETSGPDGVVGSTGVIVDAGLLVTSARAVGQAAEAFVWVSGGPRLRAHVLGVDADAATAVLRLEGVELGSPAQMAGPGDLQSSALTIAVDAGGRHVRTTVASLRQATGATTARLDTLEVRESVEGGSPASVIIDASGRLLAVAGEATTRGLRSAVPAAVARAIARDLSADGRVGHPWLGVGGHDVDAAASEHGVVVTDVQPGSPAAAAGLQTGDVIVAVGGQPVPSMPSLRIELRSHRAGDRVVLHVVRSGTAQALTATLADHPVNG